MAISKHFVLDPGGRGDLLQPDFLLCATLFNSAEMSSRMSTPSAAL